jgi:hypothetical protein
MDCMGDATAAGALELMVGLARGLSRSDAEGVEMGGDESWLNDAEMD